MNRVYHKRITIDFDVWEPQESLIMQEIDKCVKYVKFTLVHGANVHIGSVDEKTVAS